MGGGRHDLVLLFRRTAPSHLGIGILLGIHRVGGTGAPGFRGAEVMASQPTAYDLFKRDFDTQQIAEYLGISEAAALKSLTTERCAARNLASAYPLKTTPWPHGRVAYAGR